MNNACDDATTAFLQGTQGRFGPAPVELIHNFEKLGFSKGCNLGIARGRGRFLAFMESDQIVAAGWLECLTALAAHDWPNSALVGPVSNAALPPQGTVASIETPEDFESFALRRRRDCSGQMIILGSLTNSFMLTRRQILHRIGEFDEAFVTGQHAVADLCQRAREAGLRMLVAQDVYVHQIDFTVDATCPLAQTDCELLKAKWGPDLAATFQPIPKRETTQTVGDETPEQSAAATQADKNNGALAKGAIPASPAGEPERTGISLCMIVRNEETNLPECLRTIQGLFAEVIVVDTGSTDRTREAALGFGAKVVDFPWVDSFGAARNESLRHANGRWIMWLDADDRLDAENRERVRKLLAGLGDERDAYAIKVRSVLDAQCAAFRLLDQIRIFRNLPAIRWDYRIHEQILPAVNRAGGGVRWTDIIVDHVGYQNADLRRRKLERNLRLLEMDFAERPDDSFSLFNLGWTLLDLGRLNDAAPHLQRALERAKPDSSILRKIYHLLAIVRRQLESLDDAIQICRQGLERFADDAELLWEEGLMLRDQGDLASAEQSWLRLFDPRRGKYFSSEEVGLRGFRTRQFLAEILVKQERLLEAEIQWRAGIDERLDFEPAWLGLAELYLRLQRWIDLEELLQRLEGQKIAPPKVLWLRARACVQRRQHAEAVGILSNAIRDDPQAIGPRVLLCQALLQEGRDWLAAEKAILDVLAVEPEHKDAKHNLQVLRRQRARAAASHFVEVASK